MDKLVKLVSDKYTARISHISIVAYYIQCYGIYNARGRSGIYWKPLAMVGKMSRLAWCEV
ncbi:hypothetical protein CHS0354_006342, partial [Potamilus streckersoni]